MLAIILRIMPKTHLVTLEIFPTRPEIVTMMDSEEAMVLMRR